MRLGSHAGGINGWYGKLVHCSCQIQLLCFSEQSGCWFRSGRGDEMKAEQCCATQGVDGLYIQTEPNEQVRPPLSTQGKSQSGCKNEQRIAAETSHSSRTGSASIGVASFHLGQQETTVEHCQQRLFSSVEHDLRSRGTLVSIDGGRPDIVYQRLEVAQMR